MFKFISTFLCLLCCHLMLSQNKFHYQWYVRGEVRNGVLLYDNNQNKAIYEDYLDSTKLYDENAQPDWEAVAKEQLPTGTNASVVVASITTNNRYFYKSKDSVVYTTDLLQTPIVVHDKPTFDWVLENETKMIDGVLCRKATINYRGRNWIFWYTPDIPVSYGPWKFYGLPGLVVLAEEETKNFWFRLYKIENDTDVSLHKLNTEDFKKVVTMKEFLDMEDSIFEGSWMGTEGTTEVSFDKNERNGIERKYEWEEKNN